MRRFVACKIWKGWRESLEGRVQTKLQTTIRDSAKRDEMEQDKTVRVNSKIMCYYLGFRSRPSFSKPHRFSLQFAHYFVTC